MNTNFEKFFYSDVKSKKILAASARHKKNGSRSKKCTLPSDMLTNKQIIERHGETIVYNLTKPMKWSEFKKLPRHAQEEYLLWLQNNFGATATDMAELFGVIARTVSKYAESKNMSIQFQRGQRMGKEARTKWKMFLMGESDDTKQQDPSPDDKLEDNISETTEDLMHDDESADVVPRACGMTMSEVTFRFDGAIDVLGITNTLRAVLGDNINGSVFVSFKSE